jgi:alpha-tubulin suppressor-like RCC1 family protein
MPLSRIVGLATLIGVAMGLLGCKEDGSGSQTTGVIGMSLGGDHSCANSFDNGMRCWGNNLSGQLGNGTNTGSAVPLEPPGWGSGPSGTGGGATILDFAAGGSHTCAIGSGGKIFCWGSNFYGQLGVDSKIDYNLAQPVRTIIAGGSVVPATFVAAGENHTCALYSPNNVACWGRFYDLKPSSWVPGLSNAVEVKAGGNQTCVRENGGTVKCWRMLVTAPPSPAVVQGISAKKIAVGERHVCAIDQADALKCWGSNTQGQLGNGNRSITSGVVSVTRSGAFDAAIDVAAGGFHTCALFASGAVECWGSNSIGQTGQPGGTGFTLTPFRVVATGASGVAAGSVHSCARIDDGTVRRMRCWGANADGQLGGGSTSQFSVTPVQVSGLP